MFVAVIATCLQLHNTSLVNCTSFETDAHFRSIGDCYLWLDAQRPQFERADYVQTEGGCRLQLEEGEKS